jgi:hypothetical protein
MWFWKADSSAHFNSEFWFWFWFWFWLFLIHGLEVKWSTISCTVASCFSGTEASRYEAWENLQFWRFGCHVTVVDHWSPGKHKFVHEHWLFGYARRVFDVIDARSVSWMFFVSIEDSTIFLAAGDLQYDAHRTISCFVVWMQWGHYCLELITCGEKLENRGGVCIITLLWQIVKKTVDSHVQALHYGLRYLGWLECLIWCKAFGSTSLSE